MNIPTDIQIGDKIMVTGQSARDYFFVLTSSDGLCGFEWDHFIRTKLINLPKGGQMLFVQMSDCRIVINGRSMEEVQLGFMKHKISYIESSTRQIGIEVCIENVTVNGEKS